MTVRVTLTFLDDEEHVSGEIDMEWDDYPTPKQVGDLYYLMRAAYLEKAALVKPHD